MNNKELLDTLKGFSETATKGPWSHGWLYGALRHVNRNVDWDAFYSGDEDINAPEKDDAELIVTLVNNLPAILSALQGTTWIPIETAPKDGTWILVADDDYDCWMSAQWGLLNINPNKYDGSHGWSGYGCIFPDVKYWMPMPALTPPPGTEAPTGEVNG